jgi:hypothetical protein
MKTSTVQYNYSINYYNYHNISGFEEYIAHIDTGIYHKITLCPGFFYEEKGF